jgi:hypothetical protein
VDGEEEGGGRGGGYQSVARGFEAQVEQVKGAGLLMS